MKLNHSLAIAFALAVPTVAQAEKRDIPDPAAVASAARYAMPHVVSGIRTSCAPSLAPDGYLMANGDELVAKFADGSEAAWPGAKALLLEMASDDGENEGAQFIAQLPDESLKPFVDGILTTMVVNEIDEGQCADIERGLELLDPLPAENVSGLIGFILEMVEKYDTKEEEEIEAAAEVSGD